MKSMRFKDSWYSLMNRNLLIMGSCMKMSCKLRFRLSRRLVELKWNIEWEHMILMRIMLRIILAWIILMVGVGMRDLEWGVACLRLSNEHMGSC